MVILSLCHEFHLRYPVIRSCDLCVKWIPFDTSTQRKPSYVNRLSELPNVFESRELFIQFLGHI